MTPFNQIRDAFDDAERSARAAGRPVWQSACTFAGLEAQIRVAGSTCVDRILPPFRHLLRSPGEDPDGHPDTKLRIDIWDAHQTGVAYPGEAIDVERASAEYGYIVGGSDDRFIGCHRPYLVSWLDRSSGHIVACTHDARRLGLYERAKPLLFPLMMWHCDRDRDVVHAAFVEKHGSGVLFVGSAGSGKSTAALTCLEDGFNYLGDDYIALQQLRDGSFMGHSLYSSVWLDSENARRFRLLKDGLMDGELPKRPAVLWESVPASLARSARIGVILLPHLAAGDGCEVRPASPRDALLALAPTSVIKRPCSGESGFERIARLVAGCPSYHVGIGMASNNLVEVVDSLVSAEAGI